MTKEQTMLPMPGWTEVVSDTGIKETSEGADNWWGLGVFKKDFGGDLHALVFRPDGHQHQQGMVAQQTGQVVTRAYEAFLTFRGENGKDLNRAVLLGHVLSAALREGNGRPGDWILHGVPIFLQRGTEMLPGRVDEIITEIEYGRVKLSSHMLNMMSSPVVVR